MPHKKSNSLCGTLINDNDLIGNRSAYIESFLKNVFVNVNNPNFTSQAITFWINHWDAYFHVHSNQFSVEANNMATHQFMWNEWVAWLCKLNRFETLSEQIFSLWDAEWQTRMEPFISHQINCSQETCPEMYQNLLPLWRTNEELMITAWEGLGFTNNYNLRRNTYVKGSRHYELSNHLGNVLTVVSDRKIEHDERYAFAQGGGYKYENGAYYLDAAGSFAQLSASDGIISHYTAELISATDYYAFGAPLPGRTWQGGEYRFGFNGKENDNEVNGNGGQQDYGMRIYDTRIGKFLSVDPLAKSFPFYTPYQFAGNKPIYAIDLDGLEDVAYIYKIKNNNLTLVQTIDYSKTEEGVGPLGHGIYSRVTNAQNTYFTEYFSTSKDNPIGSFSNHMVPNQNGFQYPTIRLNALLVERTIENALIEMGFNESEVRNDVEAINSTLPRWTGTFATFKNNSASKYTSQWETKTKSEPHLSATSKVSKEIKSSGIVIKWYDGALDLKDDAENHIGLVKKSLLAHLSEYWRTNEITGNPENVNIEVENAKQINKTK